VIEVNSGSLVIDHSFFAPNRKLAPQAGNSFPQRNLAAFEQKHPNPAESSKGHKKNLQNAEKKSTENVIRKPAEKTEKKGHRREAILAVIRKKGEVTIKDVSLTMQEVSEKTIQRELLSLIEEGILKKEGERRWSRYSLAQPS
jgi:predicted HTH transcriptional regulator